MSVIEWSEDYAIGIRQIDQHHQHLLELLNNTYDAFVGQRQKLEVEQVVEELVNYATYHFAAEEQLMSEYRYGAADNHLKQHEYFIEQIKLHQQDLCNGRNTLSLEVIVFLKEWILNHILKCDKCLADAIVPLLEKSRKGVQINLL